MIHRTGAQIILHLLARQGVRILTGIPGGMNLPLYDALAQERRFRHVLARHEQGAGFIAQGLARMTGKPAVCLATSGPGATNLLTALADAKLDSVPVIAITGQVPRALIGTDAFQEVDTYGLSLSITKHNFLARSAAELLEIIPLAFRIAASGRPGPVLIDVPKDVQTETAAFRAWPAPGRPDPAPKLDTRALRRAARLLHAARRPVLCLGGGVVRSGAAGAARRLAQKAGLPTAMTLMGLGALPDGHPLNLGLLGMHGTRRANLALQECDLLIAAGMRFGDRATGKVEAFCPRAKIIHLDIDAAELDKLKPTQVRIIGDARAVLSAWLPLARADRRRAWRRRIAALTPEPRWGTAAPGTPRELIRRLARGLDRRAIIVTDVGQHQMWTAQHYPHVRPGHWLTSGGLGTMGFGLPVAIGAALARPDAVVACFSGDGSLLMNLQELATAAEENVNVKIFLFNNQSLGLVRQQQDLFYGRRRCACDFRHAVDFCRTAAGLGVRTVDLARARDPQERLARALRTPGPVLIHLAVDADEKVFPMVPPGAANSEMLEEGSC